MGTEDQTAFFQAHPDIAKRYAQDLAFKTGFDAYAWAAHHSPSAQSTLDSRLVNAAEVSAEQSMQRQHAGFSMYGAMRA